MRSVALTIGSIAALLALDDFSHAADPRAAELTYKPWSKFCLTASNCFMATSANGQCTPSGGAMIERLRRAQAITMDATSMAGEKLSLSFPMADFARAHDEPGRAPSKTLEQSQAELRKMMQQPELNRPPLPACEN